MVDLVEIFAPLTPTERAAIAAKLKQHSFDKGERLLESGTLPQSLFVIGSGVLSFSRRNGDVDVEVLRLGPGDHYGEIGVLTDKPSTATIVALTPVALHELAKADVAGIVEARPEVAHELARAMARPASCRSHRRQRRTRRQRAANSLDELVRYPNSTPL